METGRVERREAVAQLKRGIILDAACGVFEADGLQGASMRAIAKAAGYTPGAMYAYFPSKEHIYAAALGESLTRLQDAIELAAHTAIAAPARFVAGGLAFFDFYDDHPRDLDLGFYLFRGGIRPQGLSAELNDELNAGLLQALEPIRLAASQFGAASDEALRLAADVLAHASGLLLMSHTKRLVLFGGKARPMMESHLRGLIPGEPEGRTGQGMSNRSS